METDNKFYVYIYLDPRKKGRFVYGEYEFEHEPFYVGKGYGFRDRRHLTDFILRTDKNKLKVNKIKKIIASGLEVDVIRYRENILEKEAFDLEKDLISKIGRIDLKLGSLTNLTDGGEGDCGNVLSDEVKEKLRQAHLGKKMSLEARQHMSVGQRRKWDNMSDEDKQAWGKKTRDFFTEEKRKEWGKNLRGEKNPNFGNRWNDEQRKRASEYAKKNGKWKAELNPNRLHPEKIRGQNNYNNQYKYFLYDNGNLIFETYSLTEMSKKFNLNMHMLSKIAKYGYTYLKRYKVKRIKYR